MKTGGPLVEHIFNEVIFLLLKELSSIAHFISHEFDISSFSASNTTLSTWGPQLKNMPIVTNAERAEERRVKLLPPDALIFSSKCTKMRLAAGLRPDPLGELN